ncbi:DNA adenine methylase [Deinococcus sp. PEB2-63]
MEQRNKMSYRYLGNKTRLAGWIVEEIAKIVPSGSTVADPMCGTAAVSSALARAGYSVIAGDALTFPVIHAKTRLLAKNTPCFEYFKGYAGLLDWLGTRQSREGYFYREFGSEGSPNNGRSPRLYFSARNAARIDGIRYEIQEIRRNDLVSDLEHSIILHHLLLATNKVANISGTYGYFRSTLSSNALKDLIFEPLNFDDTPGNHEVFQGNIEDMASRICADAIYLDPPYTKRQYAGNYHILETIAREDEPEAVGDGGLRPWMEQASNFCYRRTAGKAFKETLSKIQSPHVFISYSEDGQVSEDELISILKEFGNVNIHQQEHPRYRSNDQAKDGMILERLYHIEMRKR